MEAERFVPQTPLDNFLEPDERTAADEKDVRRIDGEELLMRMFASALRRNIGDGAFQDFQQCLLYTLARDIASDRRVLIFTANLVDLVDVDNSLLRAFDIAVGRLQEF